VCRVESVITLDIGGCDSIVHSYNIVVQLNNSNKDEALGHDSYEPTRLDGPLARHRHDRTGTLLRHGEIEERK
jgi:hypothetical protein